MFWATVYFSFFCLHLSVAPFSHLTVRCFLILSFPIFCIIPNSPTPCPTPPYMQGAGCRKLPFPAEGRLRVHHGLSRMSWLLPTPLKLPGNSFVCCACSSSRWIALMSRACYLKVPLMKFKKKKKSWSFICVCSALVNVSALVTVCQVIRADSDYYNVRLGH